MSKKHIQDGFGRTVPDYLLEEATRTKKTKATVDIHLPSEKPDLEELARTDLRTVAKLYYVTDLHECSVEDMASLAQFSSVSLSTLRAWCTKDGWVEARRQVKDDWQKKLESKLGEEITRQRLVFLDEMQTIWQQGMKMVDLSKIGEPDADGIVALPKTWEGVVGAMVKLGGMMDQMATSIRDDVAPKENAQGKGGNRLQVELELTEEESQGAVKAILEKRRLTTRQKAGIEDEDILDADYKEVK